MTIRSAWLWVSMIGCLLAAGDSRAYPLDGFAATGIRRLEADLLRQDVRKGGRLAPGALLGRDDIRLHLTAEGRDFDPSEHAVDPALQAALRDVLAERDSTYALMVIDISDPQDIVWAGLRADRVQFPGSVGKVLTLTALFDGLRRAFPDVADRERILRETMIDGGRWCEGDNFHKIPVVDPQTKAVTNRTVRPNDRFSLAEWTDHMVSASANAAGAVVWREAMLLRRFGAAYPPSDAEREAFLRETPGLELQALSQQVIDEPLAAAGIDLDHIQQGTLWTKPAQARVPGLLSFASPRELARVLLRIEQGRLVDEWSSLEMKRYLYMTRPRYRYAYPPELKQSAVYFKSGSFYRCRPEEGFQCGKYKGNHTNQMNSIAIVESPARPGETPQKVYIVALTSNVLRVNSAWDHARIGAAIDEMVRTRAVAAVREDGSAADIRAAGEGN